LGEFVPHHNCFYMKCTPLSLLLLLLSFSAAYGQIDCDRLFTSFKQGERPNCASIALIKASLNVYGLNNLFDIEKVDNDNWKVTLKNNESFTLNNEEIGKARKSADFVIIHDDDENRKIVEYAVLTYAVMAKYMQIIDGEKDFDSALYDLETGAYTPTVYKYLGFKVGKQIVKLKRLSGGSYSGLVAWSSAHAVFACDRYMDYHGVKTPLWFKYSGRFMVKK